MEYTDISIDLETLDNSPRAVVTSIGAVAFNRFSGEIDAGMEFHIDIDDQTGRKINRSTLLWWLGQSNEARKVLIDGQDCSGSLECARSALRGYIAKHTDPSKVRVWGNGASFDNAILEDIYEGNPPWKFWNDRCLRTLLDEHERKTGVNLKKTMPFEGVRHGALDDARRQAKMVIIASRQR